MGTSARVAAGYAVKLMVEPGSLTAEDVDMLGQAGFSDIDMLHIAEVVSYYAYANRIDDGPWHPSRIGSGLTFRYSPTSPGPVGARVNPLVAEMEGFPRSPRVASLTGASHTAGRWRPRASGRSITVSRADL